MFPRTRPVTAVAIPAKDEADRIAGCIDALNSQDGARLDHIVVLVNNSTDRTADILRSARVHRSTTLHIIEKTLPPDHANAGFARRFAMETAASLAGPHGVLLTTDADGLVDPDWLAANLAVLRAGVDAVAGWVELHPIEWGQIPAKLHEDDARECAYDALCDEIHGLLDPDPADPLPRHTQHSGASIAVTVAAYHRCGGVPALRSGEDRALIAALRRFDASVRHAPQVHVTVSGRTVGRSDGGMAETIRRRLTKPDEFLDDRLEPAVACARRAISRAELRQAYADPALGLQPLAERLQLGVSTLIALLRQPYFGMAWEAVEKQSPALVRRLVPVTSLMAEMASARAILAEIRPVGDRGGLSGIHSVESEGL